MLSHILKESNAAYPNRIDEIPGVPWIIRTIENQISHLSKRKIAQNAQTVNRKIKYFLFFVYAFCPRIGHTSIDHETFFW